MEQQIKMINDMIAENPDATVRDYIDLLKDVEAIELASLVVPLVKVQSRNARGRFDNNVLLPVFKITSNPRRY